MNDTFESELRALLNKYSKERNSDTPDFILCNYLVRCLDAVDVAVIERRDAYNRNSAPPPSYSLPPQNYPYAMSGALQTLRPPEVSGPSAPTSLEQERA